MQLLTSVMIITLSHTASHQSAEEAEAAQRSALGLPPLRVRGSKDKTAEAFNAAWRGVLGGVESVRAAILRMPATPGAATGIADRQGVASRIGSHCICIVYLCVPVCVIVFDAYLNRITLVKFTK